MTRISRWRHRISVPLVLLFVLAIGLVLFGALAAVLESPISAQNPPSPTGSTGNGGSDGSPNPGTSPGGSGDGGGSTPGTTTGGTTTGDDSGGTTVPPHYAAPTLTSLTLKSEGILVEWQVPTTDLSIEEFELQRRHGSESENEFISVLWDGDDQTSEFLDKMHGVAVERLESANSWVYRVRALYEQDDGTLEDGDWSSELTATVPTLPKPTSPSLTLHELSYGRTRAELTWDAPTLSWSNQTLAHDGYIIHRIVSPRNGQGAVTTNLVGRSQVANGELTETLSTTALKTVRVQYAIRATHGQFMSKPLLTEQAP